MGLMQSKLYTISKTHITTMKPIKRGAALLLAPNSIIYYTRTHEDVERMHEDDRRNGNTMGEDGESRVYSRQGSARLLAPTWVVISRLNGVEWHGWGKKPTGLVVATVTTGPYIGRSVAVHRQDLHL